MSSIITAGNHPKAMWPGIFKWWGAGIDTAQNPTQWTDLVDQETSDKAYEEIVEDVGFGLLSVKPSGDALTYDSDSQGATTRFTHVAYAGGYMVAHEEMVDNLYAEVSKRRTAKLARAARATHEIVVASMYNHAFSTSYLGGDGKALCSASHPSPYGDQSNLLTAADISETAVEDAITSIMNTVDSRGIKDGLKAVSLHVATANWAESNRIVKSVLQNDTANNAVNVIRLTGQFPKGIKVNQYFDDSDAWFIRTDVNDGLLHFQREALSFDEDGTFDSKVQKYACYERYSVKWGNWRALSGNAGA